MAGGKETPRQKMIGMMYLVLTALLALQVSSAIIEKFKFLNDSLEYANGEAEKRNGGTIGGIEKAVADAGNRKLDVQVLDNARKVREMASKLTADMEATKKKLIELSGGYDEKGQLKGAKEEEKVTIEMVGGTKNGHAYQLKGQLNDFSSEVGKITGMTLPKLAMDGSEDPAFKNNTDQRNKDFAELNFAQTPLVAAMAVLSQKQSEVKRIESAALDQLAKEVGAKTDIKVDNFFAMASATSSVVAAGTKYHADMFVVASSSAWKNSTMKFNGSDIKAENGVGTVEFTATAGAYDKDGNAKKSWNGSITIKGPSGRDTTLAVTKEYVVAKPVIQVQSASVQALYFNCGNELNVQVPALGSLYDPSFSASGASTIKGAEKGQVTLIPNAGDVTLNVSSGGNAIGSQSFKVRPVPKPTVEVLSGGAIINQKQGMTAPGPRNLSVRAVAEEGFKNFLPKDARYKVSRWQVTLASGNRAVKSQEYSSESADLTALAQQAKPGMRLVIEILEVKRMNFKNEIEPVKLPSMISTVSIN